MRAQVSLVRTDGMTWVEWTATAFLGASALWQPRKRDESGLTSAE